MSIFKRIEVWVILVLAVAGLVFALLDRSETGGSPSGGSPPDADTTSADGTTGRGPLPATDKQSAKFEKSGSIEIERVTVKRDYDDYIAEVFFKYDNRSDSEVRSFEEAKLITESGGQIPVFFLAFTGLPPKLPANQKTETSLRFSIYRDDIVGSLALDIRGERAPIKSARGFDPGSIDNQKSKSFRDLGW